MQPEPSQVAVCPEGPTLAELLPRVRTHDEAASRALVDMLYPLVAKVVQANLPRRDDPEDLMQEVFMKLFSRLDQYRGDAPFEHWVSRLAVTTCLDRLRRQRVRSRSSCARSTLQACARPPLVGRRSDRRT